MPFGVVTLTSTMPVPGGEVAVIEVSLLKENELACQEPKRTSVTPVKPVPVIATTVPPFAEPEVGLIEVMAGCGK